MTDIEIAKNTKLDEINKIAEKLEIKEEDIEQYGKYKAKISNEIYEKNKKCCNETPYFCINKCNPYKFQKKGGRTCRIWTQSTVSIFAWCIST